MTVQKYTRKERHWEPSSSAASTLTYNLATIFVLLVGKTPYHIPVISLSRSRFWAWPQIKLFAIMSWSFSHLYIHQRQWRLMELWIQFLAENPERDCPSFSLNLDTTSLGLYSQTMVWRTPANQLLKWTSAQTFKCGWTVMQRRVGQIPPQWCDCHIF